MTMGAGESESGRLSSSPFPTDNLIASVPWPVLPVNITEHRYTWVSAQARTGRQDAPLPELSSHLPANTSLESSHPVLRTQSYKALDQELTACSYQPHGLSCLQANNGFIYLNSYPVNGYISTLILPDIVAYTF